MHTKRIKKFIYKKIKITIDNQNQNQNQKTKTKQKYGLTGNNIEIFYNEQFFKYANFFTILKLYTSTYIGHNVEFFILRQIHNKQKI